MDKGAETMKDRAKNVTPPERAADKKATTLKDRLPPKAAPADEAGAADEAGMPEVEAKSEETADAIGQQAPTPTEAIPSGDLAALVKALNDATLFLGDGQAPTVQWTPPKMGGSKNPLPPDVFAMLFAVSQMIQAIAAKDPQFGQYTFDPMTACATAAGVQDITRKLGLAARDQSLKDVLQKAIGEVEPGAPPPPAGGPPPASEPPAQGAA